MFLKLRSRNILDARLEVVKFLIKGTLLYVCVCVCVYVAMMQPVSGRLLNLNIEHVYKIASYITLNLCPRVQCVKIPN